MQRPPDRRKWRLQSSFVAHLKQAAWVAQKGRPLLRRKQRPLVSRGQGMPSEPARGAHELSRMVQPLAAGLVRQRPSPRVPKGRHWPEQQLVVPVVRQGFPLARQRLAAAGAAPPKTTARPAPAASHGRRRREVMPAATALVQPSNRLASTPLLPARLN